MSTGNFESWGGTLTDIGPLYPFVGSEVLLSIVGLACWIGWHVWQLRIEKREYEEEVEKCSAILDQRLSEE